MRDRAERKTGKPRRNSANFCGIRRTRRLLSTRGELPKSPSIQGFKGKPEFRLNRRASTFSGGLRRETRVGKSRTSQSPSRKNSARKKPEAGLAKKLSGEPIKKSPAPSPAKPPRQTRIKKVRRECPCPPRYWLEVSNAESNAISERGKSNERTRAADSVAPWTLSIRPSSHSTESGPL